MVDLGRIWPSARFFFFFVGKVWKSTAQRCGSFFARQLSGWFCPALIIFSSHVFFFLGGCFVHSQAPDEVIEDIIKALKVQNLERSRNVQ